MRALIRMLNVLPGSLPAYRCAAVKYVLFKAADDLNDGEKTNEDNFSLRLLSSEMTHQKRINQRAAASETDNSNEDDINHVLSLPSTEKSKLIKDENKEYEVEKKKGDMTDLFGTNQHHSYPEFYYDFGRRFVLQYPYKEVLNIKDEEAEFHFHNIAKDFAAKNQAEAHLIPVKAPPEIVLAVATKAALIEAALPHNHVEENLMNKEILRSGDYWNDVWREDVDPRILRNGKEKVIESVNVKVMPGSKLYNLVSELKKISPRLIYVMNKE